LLTTDAVCLWLQTGEAGLFDMMSDSKFEEVSREYAWRNNVSPEGVQLSYKGILLVNDQTPRMVRRHHCVHGTQSFTRLIIIRMQSNATPFVFGMQVGLRDQGTIECEVRRNKPCVACVSRDLEAMMLRFNSSPPRREAVHVRVIDEVRAGI
jgi:hypothetical protein